MDNHCMGRIRDIFRAITAFESSLQQQLGLNINEIMLLCLLSEREEPMLAGEIADEMGLTRSNASKVIAALERVSLIRRRACSQDGRCQRFHITRRGMEKLDRLHCDSICVPDALRGMV
ncbi:MarR family transcriptional regulator [Prevotella multiformis]|uniref:MarR family transcriptional regulator n=1 Tax=Prevotella multiformis TaxID=282402 RepID=UPI0028DCB536|nr:MarR family transcriptional regulator [Prevotella multiformis]